MKTVFHRLNSTRSITERNFSAVDVLQGRARHSVRAVRPLVGKLRRARSDAPYHCLVFFGCGPRALRLLACLLLACSLLGAIPRAFAQGPYQATGIKIGEVSDTSAIVWTRLTRNARCNPPDAPMVQFKTEDAARKAGKAKKARIIGVEYPDGLTVADIRNAAPGAPGEVRVAYRPVFAITWSQTPWLAVETERDFTRQFTLNHLNPNTPYHLRVESRASDGKPAGQTLEGRFMTAPARNDPARVAFTVITGQMYDDKDLPDGFKIYGQMLKLSPSFFVHTGDIVYYDKLAKNIELARYHWQRTYSLPTNVEFHRQVASYFIKDDHDAWQNDCWPTMKNNFMFQLTFEQGLGVFREQVPMGKSTYRTQRWGKDLQVWFVEGRDFRSANTDPDGPNKTIWGAAQKAWFKKTVTESDATFRVLISPTPLVGPDRSNKNDNHSNKGFTHEGDELRDFIASQKNLVVICGDRHWQYMSIHPKTGVREYSCGPASNEHAGGWNQKDFVPEYHRYLKVIGGFLSGTVERVNGTLALTFRYHGVNGEVFYEDRLTAK